MHSQQPPGVVQNWSTLQCSKQNTEQCGYDHAPVTRGRMRAQYPLPHGPILRVLDPKKQVVEAYRSRKQHLQHPCAPKFAIFHGKNGQKWPLFGQKLGFLASDQQLKPPPPYFEGAGCEKAGCRGI